jgi:hypothetical protein
VSKARRLCIDLPSNRSAPAANPPDRRLQLRLVGVEFQAGLLRLDLQV